MFNLHINCAVFIIVNTYAAYLWLQLLKFCLEVIMFIALGCNYKIAAVYSKSAEICCKKINKK